MNDDNKILACVDQSSYAESVTDYATWAAKRLQAPMELLHVIDRHPRLEAVKDHSGAIGLDAQENLLKQLSDEDETRTRAAREVGRVFLNGQRERAMASGAPVVDVRQRHGELETTLAEIQAVSACSSWAVVALLRKPRNVTWAATWSGWFAR